MLVAFSISPTSGDDTGSVSEAVAAAVRVVKESGLPWELTSMFTTIEGEWDEVMAVVKRAVDVVAEVSPRVGLVLKADIRPGFEGQLSAKVDRVQALLDRGGLAGDVEPVGLREGPGQPLADQLVVVDEQHGRHQASGDRSGLRLQASAWEPPHGRGREFPPGRVRVPPRPAPRRCCASAPA